MEENNVIKTPEELQTENNILSSQLQELSEKVKGLGSLLVSAKERNVKLAYSTRLFAELHLTKEEKMVIAQEIDKAVSAEQVEKLYHKYYNQVVPDGVEIEDDFKWSQQFTRDLEKYYFKYKGYNPFESIYNATQIIRLQFRIEDDLRVTDDPEKVKSLRESWQTNRESSIAAIDEILSVTNEILKK